MSFIIPNPKEYDMRMEGENAEYRQMISDCLVLKSDSPNVQSQVSTLERAVKKMTVDK
jgi:hypothetical protein